MTSPLTGRRVLVTRERPGELARLLADRGALVVHMPLIAVVEPDDGGAALRTQLDRLGEYDWLVVTSPAGAARVVDAVVVTPSVRIAVVGTATASIFERRGRRVDLVPRTQQAVALADEFTERVAAPQRVLVAQADRAAPGLVDLLRAAGHLVEQVVAYRTVDLPGDPDAVTRADAVAFASGSAVESWHAALGTTLPAVSVAIGPSTAAVAERLGLKLGSVAADQSLDGLVSELERQFASWTDTGG